MGEGSLHLAHIDIDLHLECLDVRDSVDFVDWEFECGAGDVYGDGGVYVGDIGDQVGVEFLVGDAGGGVGVGGDCVGGGVSDVADQGGVFCDGVVWIDGGFSAHMDDVDGFIWGSAGVVGDPAAGRDQVGGVGDRVYDEGAVLLFIVGVDGDHVGGDESVGQVAGGFDVSEYSAGGFVGGVCGCECDGV